MVSVSGSTTVAQKMEINQANAHWEGVRKPFTTNLGAPNGTQSCDQISILQKKWLTSKCYLGTSALTMKCINVYQYI